MDTLSKLIALEATIEYLVKATPGEKLEYLGPGEKAPGDIRIYTTERGARGYYPSEVDTGEEDALAPSELAPGEEQEVEVVQAPEAKSKPSSDYPKRVFDHATEQYLNVVVPDDSEVHGVKAADHQLRQPHGAPVRGTPISIYDPRIPDTVYHMTTNAPAVRASKKLIAGGVGGLGGDDKDQIVSLTISKEIAYQLADDIKLASEVTNMERGESKSPERIESSKEIFKRLLQEMEKEGWHSDNFSSFSEPRLDFIYEGYNSHEWLTQYFTSRASETKKLGKEKRNPLFFTDSETLAKVNPENIDVIEIPKNALRTGAMITDFDLNSQYGLQEIRVYGDVGVSAPEAGSEVGHSKQPWEMTQEEFESPAPLPQAKPGNIILYHATEEKNLASILQDGLDSTKGDLYGEGPQGVVWGVDSPEGYSSTGAVVGVEIPESQLGTPKGATWKWVYGSISPDAIVYVDTPSKFTGQRMRDERKSEYAKSYHEWHVEEAIADGKHVPDEVLRDYPDLRQEKSDNLSKLLVLEDYLSKATAEDEQREYDPKGFHEGPRHGHYFKPGEREVGGKEVEVVQAPEAEPEDKVWQTPEEGLKFIQERINDGKEFYRGHKQGQVMGKWETFISTNSNQAEQFARQSGDDGEVTTLIIDPSIKIYPKPLWWQEYAGLHNRHQAFPGYDAVPVVEPNGDSVSLAVLNYDVLQVQAPELPKSGIEFERNRQRNQATELEALDLVHPEDITDGGYSNVIKRSDATDLVEPDLLNEGGANAENLYERAIKLGLDKVTVWHGTTGKGATGILTDGAIGPAKTGGGFGAGFNMSPKAASSWAGGKAIGPELKHSVDRLPMIIQFDIPVELLKDITHDQSSDAYSIEDHKVRIPLDLETTKILYSDDPDTPFPNRNFNLLKKEFFGVPRHLLKKVDQKTDNLSKAITTTDSIRIGNLDIPVEIATDPVTGLSWRDSLAPGTGMLFDLNGNPVITMKGMKFPLDLVWMTDGRVVDLTENALVPVLGQEPLYIPEAHATAVLEINGGEVQRLGIKIGDFVKSDNLLTEQSNLSKLLVLETALEHLFKVDTAKREYLKPGETAPEGLKEYPGSRSGVRYYVPGEAKPEQELPSRGIGYGTSTSEGSMPEFMHGTPSDLSVEEREIEVVQPEETNLNQLPYKLIVEVQSDRGELYVSHDTEAAQNYNHIFDNQHTKLAQVLGPDSKIFLGSEIKPERLTADNLESVGFTDGSLDGIAEMGSIGINAANNFTVKVDGKRFIYKTMYGDNRAEMLGYSVDRALGLNIVPYVKSHSIDIEKLYDKFLGTWNKSFPLERGGGGAYLTDLHDDLNLGGGHFMEFCENCLSTSNRDRAVIEMLMTKEGREEFIKIMLLDTIILNPDRHTGNWMLTDDHKIIAIDNGLAGDGAGMEGDPDSLAEANPGSPYNDSNNFQFPGKLESSRLVGPLLTSVMEEKVGEEWDKEEYAKIMSEAFDPEAFGEEISNVFDKYFDFNKLNPVTETVNWKILPIKLQTRFKENFVESVQRAFASPVMGLLGSLIPGYISPLADKNSISSILFPDRSSNGRDR